MHIIYIIYIYIYIIQQLLNLLAALAAGLAADKTIVIKPADKGSLMSLMVVWDRSDYLHGASRQLQDQDIYENVKFIENILTDLVAKSNRIFKRLCGHKVISEKELKYFTYNFKKVTLGKLYFLPKIHEYLSAVQGRPVISNFGTPTEKVSQYLDYILKPIIQNSWSSIKDSIKSRVPRVWQFQMSHL